MKVVWLPPAVADLERLQTFLAEAVNLPSNDVASIIRDAARSLATFPERCRRVPGRSDFRELFVEARSQTYVIQFRIAGDSVIIIRVWHGREAR